MDHVWICPCCGKQYNSLPLAFALDEPDPWRAVPEAQRKERGELTSDACVIDGREFYVRGRIVIPVVGSVDTFVWGVWASVSRESFERIGALWDVNIREHEPPHRGLLSNDIPIYPKTFTLRCTLQLQNAGRRPSIVLDPTDHPLAVEQRSGITPKRIEEIASKVMRHQP